MALVVYTPDEILWKGLDLAGFDISRKRNVNQVQNLERFKAHYGSHPVVYAQIWEDMQTTEIAEARNDTSKVDLD